MTRAQRRNATVYSLSGLLRCVHCGERIRVVRTERRHLEGRLARLRGLYSWGDLPRDEYQRERDRIERELARLAPRAESEDRVEALARYVESLPAAWADATPEQRSQLANLIYEEVCVDGPVVEYVKPRPDLEPLFQVRAGASQPLDCLSHSNVGRGDPDGGRDPICHICTGWRASSLRLWRGQLAA